MRVPYELRAFFEGQVDAVATVRTSLAGTFGTIWLVVDSGRLAAFELDGLMGDPEPVALASDRPLELSEVGFDSLLVVRTADGAEHSLKLSSWDARDIAALIALAGAASAAAPLDEPARPTASSAPEPPPALIQLEAMPTSIERELPTPPSPSRTPRPRQPERPRREVTRRPPPTEPIKRPPTRARRLSLLIALLVVGAAGAAAYYLSMGGFFGPDEWCGDGIVSTHTGSFVIDAPIVTSPLGATGPVCDDGGSGWNGTFEVADDGDASEHGICQALGYDRALSVTWGGGPGEDSAVMPHAGNWSCRDYECGAGSGVTTDNCTQDEMLVSITCERQVQEQCDEADRNGDEPGATCRSDCTWPRCGDGVVDGNEACDDGNAVSYDACTNDCQTARCGDGIRQSLAGERCDDGNAVDGDGCDSTCHRDDGACHTLVIADDARALTTVSALLATYGVPHDTAASQAQAASDLALLLEYNLVIFYHHSRAMLSDEAAALTAYLENGGRLLLTGYDSLGAPTDNVAAGVVRLTSEGDGPFEGNCRVVTSSHPATVGVFGHFVAGTTFSAPETDHDRASTAANPETAVLVALADGTPKLTVAEGIGAGGGTAYYWNGNRYANDWVTPGHARSIFLNLLDVECGVSASGFQTPSVIK